MIRTKRLFKKEGGCQGYHFVISFASGTCTKRTAYVLTKEFCERYLGNWFEYVFVIHTDQPHLHAHILFNSVSRINGKKYCDSLRSWNRYIQPLTDELCRKYGLPALTYDKFHKKGMSYAEYLAKKKGLLTQADVIRADIDMAILRAKDPYQYMKILRAMEYTIQIRSTAQQGTFFSYHAPGYRRPRSDYRLGTGYRIDDIVKRINHKEKEQLQGPATELSIRYCIPVLYLKSPTLYQTGFIRRIQQATTWQYLAFRREEQARVRKDLLKIDQLREECMYLIDHNLESEEDVNRRYLQVDHDIKHETRKIKSSEITDQSEKRTRIRYKELFDYLKEPDLSPEDVEYIVKTMKLLERTSPTALFPEKKKVTSPRLEALKQERRILKRILKETSVSALVKDVPYLPLPAAILQQAKGQNIQETLPIESPADRRQRRPEMTIRI